GMDAIYNERLQKVRRGVDTYWLNIPLRTGITQKHSLNAEGGDRQMRYGIGFNYQNDNGVMKGSGRQTWGANVNLMYHKNNIRINNSTYVNGYDANNSPYGSFSTFAQANPYFKKKDDDGKVNKYLEIAEVKGVFEEQVANPLYNVLMGQKDNTTSFSIQNNMQAIWTFWQGLRLQGAFQLSKGNNKAINYIPPENTRF